MYIKLQFYDYTELLQNIFIFPSATFLIQVNMAQKNVPDKLTLKPLNFCLSPVRQLQLQDHICWFSCMLQLWNAL